MTRKRQILNCRIEVNGQPLVEYIQQIPMERWEPFLDLVTDLLARDFLEEHRQQENSEGQLSGWTRR